eukprot:378171-Pyramimonas_sp.AAC.1
MGEAGRRRFEVKAGVGSHGGCGGQFFGSGGGPEAGRQAVSPRAALGEPAAGDREPQGQELDASEEAQRPKTRKIPVQPSREEVEENELQGHVQYRTWCRHCVAARAYGQPHREVVEDDPESTEAIPEIVTDYFYMGEEEKAATHVFIKDRVTSMIGATVLDGKTSTYAAKYFTNFLVELGYRRIILKSDNEPALLKLRREAVKDMQIEVVPRESPVSDHQANGAAESGVREAKKGIRALKTSTEDRYGRKLAEDHVLLAWLARHVVQTSNRYKVGEDGRTPVQRSTGRRWKKPALLFGECIMARLA